MSAGVKDVVPTPGREGMASHICFTQEKTPQVTWSATPELWCKAGLFFEVWAIPDSLTFMWPCLHSLGCVHTITI